MRNILIAIILFSTINLVIGQNYILPENNFYKKGKITFTDFKKIEVSNLEITTDSLKFVNINTNKSEIISFAKINYIRVKTGNHMGSFAVIGGLFASLPIMWVLPPSEFNNSNGNGTSIVAVSFAIGFIVGGIVGVSTPRWKTYYINYGTGMINKIEPDIYVGQNSIGLKIQISMN